MENPKCSYCGGEMDAKCHTFNMWDTKFYFECSCGARTPMESTPEAAYAAAMKREKKCKTYAEDFKEKHPKADMLHTIPLTGHDIPNLCRAIIYGETMNCPVAGCRVCWDKEMEDEDE